MTDAAQLRPVDGNAHRVRSAAQRQRRARIEGERWGSDATSAEKRIIPNGGRARAGANGLSILQPRVGSL